MKSVNNDEYLHISYKIFLIVLVLCQIDEEIVPHLILEMTKLIIKKNLFLIIIFK